jgi:1-acyl-sn-glycerol-3-phosphate acyltransferase
MFRKIFQPLYTLYALTIFVVSVLVGFPFFMLISIRSNPASRRLLWGVIRIWAKCWLWLIGMPVKVSGVKPPTDRRYIIVANHISYLDALTLFPAVPQYFRALGKKEFSRIPVVGLLYKQIALLVDRSSHHSRTKSMRLMWRALKNESNIAIFPEGTFNETGAPLKVFYDGAFRLAINAHAPIVPLIFPDAAKRWHYSAWWKLSPGRNRAILLAPIPCDNLTLEDLPILKARVWTAMEDELKKHDYP